MVTAIVTAQDVADITIEITNISSNDGKMMVGLYDSEENWLKNTKMLLIGTIKNGECKVIFEDVPNGIYAVSSYHDENDNDKLDTNFLGIPKEDTGSSNNAPARMGPPKWEDAKFKIEQESIKLNIKL